MVNRDVRVQLKFPTGAQLNDSTHGNIEVSFMDPGTGATMMYSFDQQYVEGVWIGPEVKKSGT